ncbi:endonuclease III domain-containing protein [Salinisphaera aquimarina]|uniref:Endonuclease III domain-containing protein n=1 Tax=Salinisphaera aquimarina TaxID=2094031 RepID=A0ABV7ESI8_9GAMM
MAAGDPTPQALRAFHDDLSTAYGPQRWWPTQDADNPRFEILVGAVLTQHTAWTNVDIAIAALREAGPLTAEALLAHADLPVLIRRAGPHNVKARRLRALCQWFVDNGGFETLAAWPSAALRRELLALHGIGFETADVILLYAFERPAFVADAYAFRILERYGWWRGRRNYERLRQQVEHAGPTADAAFYDELHALIVAHAKQRCHKRAPDCGQCVLASRCACALKAAPDAATGG